jgi:hypothetical protein
MKKSRRREYLKKFFQLKAEEQIYMFAINRYNLLRDERMVKRYSMRIQNEIFFELENLIKENRDFAFDIDYEKESKKYVMTEKATKIATLKCLGKAMTIDELVRWSVAQD